jgi:4-hydroxyphenylpyruvate dioxygenase
MGDSFPLMGIDHLHFYCGNAKQAAHYYRSAFGFRLTHYSGPETGMKDLVSYVIEQGRIRFVLSTALKAEHPVAQWVAKHGDGVRTIAFEVEDASAAWKLAVERGADGEGEPFVMEDGEGRLGLASVKTYGDVIHTFVDRGQYQGGFGPTFRRVEGEDRVARPSGLRAVDHIVGNVGWRQMNEWVAWYERVLGFTVFQHFDDKDISTEYSALMSKVMASGNGRIKFPINEPAEARKRSQIEEYLDFNCGPGVQHVAMLTGDIVETVGRLHAQGVEFLRVPTTYYEELQARVGRIDEPVEELARLGVLVDRDDEGYLLQIFTKPVADRPTLFFEIIQRKGSRSFGKGNFKALFEAIEREQAARGNL